MSEDSGGQSESSEHNESVDRGSAGPEFPVVGVGASAGGLEAFKGFLSSMPDAPGLALILVQHLDPTHDSMLVELLS